MGWEEGGSVAAGGAEVVGVGVTAVTVGGVGATVGVVAEVGATAAAGATKAVHFTPIWGSAH